MTEIKICGIKNIEHALAAVDAGADAIGFVFAKSKRQVTIDEAKDIADNLPSSVKKIGVFVNASKEVLEHTARFVGLDYIQLHGDETLHFCKKLNVPYIKSIRVKSEMDLQAVGIYQDAAYILLDSGIGPERGGNGTRFDWELLDRQHIDRNKLILAGGLTPENVQEAISLVQPAMVDVSSGVETGGVKDTQKIYTFVQNVKERL
ncbi:phosphoribosylanthranilate isomerase [Bacillaceae bacterium W0354]